MTQDEQLGIDALLSSNTLRGTYLRVVLDAEPDDAGMDRLAADLEEPEEYERFE